MNHPPFLNYAELATSPEHILALDIAAAGMGALAPEALLRRILRWNAPRSLLTDPGALMFIMT